ncbi:cation diffusion facilitator family transporter [Megasphaera paucivorans]|uniref:Cation diffusion facilitator family transporter n=1 Tax=Megasphaera paucivorans TaxID=349095 RepID=A0A1G9Z1H4_9FIRM|nr:cation diffusion facilitator family transporter [Megasphaera paucivorans]SDN15252.1 cation diffusion facilitator family transporter [Megasphaera paucivorans]
MIKYIIRSCITDYKNTTDKLVREKYSILSGILGIICNLFLFVSKFLVGISINSIAIISDAFNNLSDMGSSSIIIISAKLSNKPPDKEHPFGHGRFEYLASLTIGIIIMVVGYQLINASVHKFFDPEPLTFNYWSLCILLVSIAIKGWMYCYNNYIGSAIQSSVNEATASDSINDVIATTGVLITTIIQLYTTLPVDALAGTAIGLLILYTGFAIVKKTVNILLGKAASPELTEAIRSCVMNGKYIVGTHDLKIHDYGPGRIFASIHAEVPDTSNLVEVHAILDELEEELSDKFQIDINIHMDPLCTDLKIITRVRHILDLIIQKEYPCYHTDHLRITYGKARLNVICDLHIPPTEMTEEQMIEIRKNINTAIIAFNPRYRVVIAKFIPEDIPSKKLLID